MPALAVGPDSATEALFQAVHRNDVAAARRAIENGARPTATNEWGLTPADVALDKGYFPLARYLMEVPESVAEAPAPEADWTPQAVTVDRPTPEPEPESEPEAAEAPDAAPEREPTPEPAPVAEAAPEPASEIVAEPEPIVETSPEPAEPAGASAPENQKKGFIGQVRADLRQLMGLNGDPGPDVAAPEPAAQSEPKPEPKSEPKPEPAPEPAPERQQARAGSEPAGEGAFMDRLQTELRRLFNLEPSAGTPPETAETGAPEAAEPAARGAESATRESAAPEVTPPPAEDWGRPRVRLNKKPEAPAEEEPPADRAPPAAEEAMPEAEMTPPVEQMSAQPAPGVGEPGSTPQPAAKPADGWAPRRIELARRPAEPAGEPVPQARSGSEPAGEAEPLAAAEPEPESESKSAVESHPAAPAVKAPAARAEEPGLLAGLVSGIKGWFGGSDGAPKAEGEVPATEKPAVSQQPRPEPEDSARPAAMAASPEAAGSPPADGLGPLAKLGIRNIEKYLADDPTDLDDPEVAAPVLGETDETSKTDDGGGSWRAEPRPAPRGPDSGRADPFDPGGPAIGSRGLDGGPEDGGGFDARFDRNPAFAPLGKKGGGGEADEAAEADEAGPAPAADARADQLAEAFAPVKRPAKAMEEDEDAMPQEAGAADADAGSGSAAQVARAMPDREPVPVPAPGSFDLPQPTRKPLADVIFTVAGGHALGRELDKDIAWSETGYRQSCVVKQRRTVVFCVELADWPADIAEAFEVNTILYAGKQVISRYDDGEATNYHVLFPSDRFNDVVAHMEKLYGPPSDVWTRRVAPLARERRDNPVVVWVSRDVATGRRTLLEVRPFDDTRGGFPDLQHGTIVLHYADAPPVFPRLSLLDLMVMKPENDPRPEPPTEESNPFASNPFSNGSEYPGE